MDQENISKETNTPMLISFSFISAKLGFILTLVWFLDFSKLSHHLYVETQITVISSKLPKSKALSINNSHA